MFDTFIWDFDGTIFDSYPHITASMVKMASNHGIIATSKEIRDALEVNHATAYKLLNLTLEQIKEFREYERDYKFEPEVVPFKMTKTVLKSVVDSGRKNYIYTHRGKESTFYYLEKFDLMKYFSDFITSDDKFPLKPNPCALLALSKRCRIDPKKALMIGDREIDVSAGVNAGMTGCLITTKTNISCAKYIVSDIGDILTLI
ncbi:MAG: HAD family hydrolase [Ruminococcaceae bacterium]|nr:HAD family hydrolase [Oscillospiraceae bacterium]